MKKPTFLVFGFVFLAVLCSCKSISVEALYTHPVLKHSDYDMYPFGGFGFGASLGWGISDKEIGGFKIDLYPWAQEGTEGKLMGSIGIYFKYPFNVGRTALYPKVGYELMSGLSAGAGIDVPLNEAGKFIFRGETQYGIGGSPFSEIVKTGTLMARAGIGYNFSGSSMDLSLYKIDYAPSLPDYQKATILFSIFPPTNTGNRSGGGSGAISQFDGTNVSWGGGIVDRTILIAPGVHTLSFYYTGIYDFNHNITINSNPTIEYEFKPGVTYQLYVKLNNNTAEEVNDRDKLIVLVGPVDTKGMTIEDILSGDFRHKRFEFDLNL